jgi:hypothetical protein
MMIRSHFLIPVLVVTVGVLTLVVIGWLFFGSTLTFLAVFPWLVASLTASGIHLYLARALALPVAALIVWAVLQSLSLDGRNRRRGLLVCVTLYCLWASVMWLMTRHYNFDPMTGAALHKYAATPYGFEAVPVVWTVHPIFGTKALPMTPEVARAIDLQAQMGPSISEQDALFGPDGTALAWYSETPEDGIELFRIPGRHPRKNIPLMPVTSEIARRLVNGREDIISDSKLSSDSRLEGLQRLQAHLERAQVATE